MGRASDLHANSCTASTECRRSSRRSRSSAKVEPFKTVLSGDREAIAKIPLRDFEEIAAATLTGMTVEEFEAEVNKVACRCKGRALEAALHRSHLPADAGGHEYLRHNGYKTYIVTGGGQDFVRMYAEQRLRHPARASCRQRRRQRPSATTSTASRS